MTTRRNFLKTGSISLAGLLVGEKVYSAVSTPDNKKSFSTIASKVTGDYASKRPAPEARKFTSKAVEEQLKASKADVYKRQDLVIVSEYCQKCHIDPSFIILLEEGGLIDINITDGERYLFSSQLRDLEQYTRMYYDLSINIEGIDAIHHMLDRMRNLQAEIQSLRNRLHLYEPFGFDTIENF